MLTHNILQSKNLIFPFGVETTQVRPLQTTRQFSEIFLRLAYPLIDLAT